MRRALVRRSPVAKQAPDDSNGAGHTGIWASRVAPVGPWSVAWSLIEQNLTSPESISGPLSLSPCRAARLADQSRFHPDQSHVEDRRASLGARRRSHALGPVQLAGGGAIGFGAPFPLCERRGDFLEVVHTRPFQVDAHRRQLDDHLLGARDFN